MAELAVTPGERNPAIPEEALRRVVARALPGAELLAVTPLGVDDREVDGATTKSAGYGVPLKLTARRADGEVVALVFHTATANVFGHDWRSDRAAEMLLAFDTFGAIPDHIAAIDVGAVARGGRCVSLRDAGEFYLLTRYAPGAPYADDLRRIVRDRRVTARDRERVVTLARWLAALHTPADQPDSIYRRSVRDVVGSGEGIFGIVDGYPPDVPAAPPTRLRAIERSCLDWRWRVRSHGHRLRRIHGDFHPFNVLFDGDRLAVLDASRGSVGDPANDVACMAVNYVFFALDGPGARDAWRGGFRDLWSGFWSAYLAARDDAALFDVVAPYLTWRILVLCNPRWYPELDPVHRDRLLGLAERALAARRFDPDDADRVFGGARPS